MSKHLITLLLCTFSFIHSYGQNTLAEKLGYPKDAKLLIVHADDVGVSHSENAATIAALEKGGVNSASIMVPCPWFPEIAAYAKQHPELDWGIHITLTSEWKNYKWSGVSSSNEISSVLNKDKFLYPSVEDFIKSVKSEEAEKEIRAQIDKALSFGIKLTHLDSHMGSIFASPELLKIYQKIGKEYGLAVLLPVSEIRKTAPQILNFIDTNYIGTVNNFAIANTGIAADKWNEFYKRIVQNLKPGLNEMIFHLAFDDDESKAVTIDHPDFGAAWRQRDFNYVTSKEFKALLKKENIRLVTWGHIQKVLYKK